MGQHDYTDINDLDADLGLIEMAESKITDEMISINKEITRLNGRLRRCVYEKACLDEKKRKLEESVNLPYFLGS